MKKKILNILLSLSLVCVLFLGNTNASTLNGWYKINGNEFYYQNGTALKGLQKIGQTTYLFNSRGEKQRGWHIVNGKVLYFSLENGGMLTGLRKIGQTTYLLTSEGKKYGWHKLDNKEYYFDPNFGGGLVTGLRKVGQTTYLLTLEGKKYGWHRINSKDYYFDPNFGGGIVTGLRKIGQATYLLTLDGKMYGWHMINGKDYYFDVNSGVLTTGVRSESGYLYEYNSAGEKKYLIGKIDTINNSLIPSLDSNSKYFLNLINNERAKRGLNPLVLSDRLNSWAKTRVNEINSSLSFNNIRPNGDTFLSITGDDGDYENATKYLNNESIILLNNSLISATNIYNQVLNNNGYDELMYADTVEIGIYISSNFKYNNVLSNTTVILSGAKISQ